jgi:tetratricopeptide (TPR) repeat protein
VLSERQLEKMGLVAAGAALRKQLPQVRQLVGGRIEAIEEDHFRITLSALDTQSAQTVFESSAEGRYPGDLDEALATLADGLAERLAAPPAPAERRERIGFTRSPEIAIQFYKGLDHSIHGRPEFAAEYFRQAHLADPTFWIAAAWRARAYEQLGLQDLAGYVRGVILADPEGRRAFGFVARALAHERGELLVALSRSPDADTGVRALEDRVAEALVRQQGIGLFSAAWIRALAEELDLRLSGELAPYDVASQVWLAVDATVRVDWSPADGRLELALLDAVSGEELAREETVSDESGLAGSVRRLVALLANATRSSRSPRARGLEPLAPLDYALPPGDINSYTRQRYAYLLRDFADHPTDLPKLARHIEVHDAHSHSEYVPGTYDKEWPYLELLWQRMLAAADPDDPDAPNWLSYALWNLRLHGFGNADGDSPHWWYNRGKRVPPLEEHFAPLLREHPESLATLCVRYAIALEHLEQGRHAAAAKLLRELAHADHEVGDLSLDFGAIANIHLVAALAARRVGDDAEAEAQARQAAHAADMFVRFHTPRAVREQRPVRSRHKPVQPVVPAVAYTPPGRGGHAEGGFYVTSMSKTIFVDGKTRFRPGESLNAAIAQLAQNGGTPAAEPSLGDRYREATRLAGAAGLAARLAYLEALTREVADGEPHNIAVYFTRPMDTIIPWLHEHANAADRPTLEAAVSALADRVRERYGIDERLILELYAAAGMDDEVLAVAEPEIAARNAHDRAWATMAKAEVLERRQGPAHAGRFAEAQLSRFERDFPELRGTNYLDIIHTAGQLFARAGEYASAIRIYQRGIAAPLYADSGLNDAEVSAAHQRASMRYRMAVAQQEHGNVLDAAQLLRQVIESAEPHPDWKLHYSGHGSRTVGTLSLYRAAVERLESLRFAPAAHRAAGAM